MVDLKKWMPFRFPRQAPRNPELPARTKHTGPLSITSLRDEMDRMFERFWTNPFAALETQDRWFGDFSQDQFVPKLDVTDDNNLLKVTLELPGVDPKDIDIDAQEGMLTIKGEKRHEETKEDEGCYRTERSYGFFQRSVPLPADIDTTKTEAKFDKGVLTVAIPKVEKAKKQPVKIAVKS